MPFETHGVNKLVFSDANVELRGVPKARPSDRRERT